MEGKTEFGRFPDLSTERMIGIFCAGQRISVSRRVTKKKPDLECLEGLDEIWALCIRARALPPGWRLLGRFYDRNVLVLFRAWDKRHLASQYPEAATEIREWWEELFKGRPPHRGKQIADYIGGVFYDVDEIES
jgi:hypothetical protein